MRMACGVTSTLIIYLSPNIIIYIYKVERANLMKKILITNIEHILE
jgi:hypothetical protein